MKPEPFGPVPSAAQLNWHQLERYALIHFSISTFTDSEWSYGEDSPTVFNPTEFNAEQWAQTCVDTGLKGMILVCKHHDGFCLWPTETTDYSVKNSPWQDGKGDVVAEVSAACRKYGLKFGFYCSPWDRNNAEYGRPGYVDVFHGQLRELLTNYGDIFEVWFDGANGGDGYYGGTHERRPIDASTYYQWDKIKAMVKELQPNAVIFGIDVRFVGNECGVAKETCWHTYPCSTFDKAEKPPLGEGQRNGKQWVPAECDFPLRHGWFYHEHSELRQPDQLIELYFKSIGRGCSMDIGLSPDTRGLIHDKDIAILKDWNDKINEVFQTDLLQANRANITASSESASARNTTDNQTTTYWAASPDDKNPALIIEFDNTVKFNVLEIAEFIQLGQRIDSFAIDIKKDGTWEELATATSIGYKRLLMTRTSVTDSVRIRFTETAATPVIAKIALFEAPAHLILNGKVAVTRDQEGNVNIRSSNSGLAIHYTLDGSDPTQESPLFTTPIPLPEGGTVKAIGFVDDARTAIASATFGQSRKEWKIHRVSLDSPFENQGEAGVEKILDDNPDTYWHTYHKDKKLSAPPHEVVLDMGKERTITAVTMMPNMGGDFGGEGNAIPDQYEYHLSLDDQEWQKVAEGEFANIKANPCMQTVNLDKAVKARYLRFVAKHATGDADYIMVAGIGAIEA